MSVGDTILLLTDTAATAGEINQAAIASLDSSRIVTAMRDDGNNLRLIPWRLGEIGDDFTFDDVITDQQRTVLLERHRFAFSSIQACNSLSPTEKGSLVETYRKTIDHGISEDPKANASAFVGGSKISINFNNLFPKGNNEIAQTLIHEMMHCAGFDHPERRDSPEPNPDVPGDNGPYYGTAPLRAELCIAGTQSIIACKLNADGARFLNRG